MSSHCLRRALWFILASLFGSAAHGQSELLIWRYTYLNDQQHRMEMGRLRAEGFISESGANETYSYSNPTEIEQIKRISGQPLLPVYGGSIVPGAGKNLQLSEDLFTIGIRQFRVVRWFDALTGRCLNVATRAALTGSATLIPGFYIVDRETPVVVRAVGPGLNAFGVVGMPNPRLQIYDSLGKIVAENDDWEATAEGLESLRAAMGRSGGFPLDPQSKDAAVFLTLNPGTYTVHARSSDGVGGEVLAEVYILEPVPPPFSFSADQASP